jgi:hypothetical protein
MRGKILLITILSLAQWRTASAGDRYAFLVGVREYDPTELTSLEYTEKDVTDLADVLKQADYPAENIVLMTQAIGARKTRFSPIGGNIRNELALLSRELKEDDTLIVAFSGHGVQFKGTSDIYFCPSDARLANRATLLSLTKIYEGLGDARVCKAKNKVLLVDACRNNPQSKVSKDAKEIELEPAGVVERPTPPGGIAAIYSCSQGEKSFEHPDLQHGVFANFLIEAFSGKGDIDNDGEITLNELETFSVKATQRYARNVFGKPQTPERRGETRGLVSLAKLGRSVPASPTPTIPEKMPNNSATPQKAASGQLSDGNRAYEVSSNNSLGLKLVWIPSGTFTMGSPSSEAGRDGDESQVSVTLTKGYWLGQTEVTQGQWKQLMGTEPWKGQPYVKEGANYPATYVSWEDAMEFCQKLTEAERRAGRLAANR